MPKPPSSCTSAPATASTKGWSAGWARPSEPFPSLPPATTTTTPAAHARSSAAASGSAPSPTAVPLSRLRLSTPMSRSSACSATHSTPATTWGTETSPSRPAALTATIPASGATPRNHSGWSAATAGSASASRPAMMPAMCEPWPFTSTWATSGSAASDDTSTEATTLPGASRPATGATPVSSTATLTPSPVTPRSHSARAPICWTTAAIEPVEVGAAEMGSMAPTGAERPSSAAAVTPVAARASEPARSPTLARRARGRRRGAAIDMIDPFGRRPDGRSPCHRRNRQQP